MPEFNTISYAAGAQLYVKRMLHIMQVITLFDSEIF